MITRTRAGVLGLGIAAQLIITLLFLWRAVPGIEDELHAAADESLRDAGLAWAEITVSGRDLTLTGLAPTPALAERAVDLLDEVRGLRVVYNRLSISRHGGSPANPPSEADMLRELEAVRRTEAMDLPYGLRIEREASLVTLTGVAPDGESRSSLIEIARQKYGGNRVIDRLIVAEGAPAGYLHAATVVLELSEMVSDGVVGVREQQIFVEAMMESDRDLRRLRSAVQATLPPDYTAAFQVGSRQELASVLRQNPELAARIGPLPAGATSGDDGIDLGRAGADEPGNQTPPTAASAQPQFGAQALANCRQAFAAATTRTKISFGTASTEMSDDSKRLLDDLIDIAKQCPEVRIEIGGHTDDQGLESNNIDLSQRRADAVAVYLIRGGIAGSRLTAVGYGESQPLVENRTAEHRATNRRIEFKLGN